MLIHWVKFIHVILALSLLGSVVYCLALVGSRKFSSSPQNKILRLKKIMMVTALLALITGTLLVYPKNFTFHTPWIQAAYLLVGGFCLLVGVMIFLKKKMDATAGEEKISRGQQWLWRLAYLVLIIILIAVVHDAVTKTTFLIP